MNAINVSSGLIRLLNISTPLNAEIQNFLPRYSIKISNTSNLRKRTGKVSIDDLALAVVARVAGLKRIGVVALTTNMATTRLIQMKVMTVTVKKICRTYQIWFKDSYNFYPTSSQMSTRTRESRAYSFTMTKV